jgi:hypothetical protein
MFSIKFIGENLNFLPTARAFAHERFQILKLLKAWTMSRDAHKYLLFSNDTIVFLCTVLFQLLQGTHQVLKGRSLVDIVDVDITNDSLLIDNEQSPF